MKFSEEVSKVARGGFEEGRGLGVRILRPPLNTTMAEIYGELYGPEDAMIETAELKSRIKAGTRIWERITIRFALRVAWYRIKWGLWKWRTRRGAIG